MQSLILVLKGTIVGIAFIIPGLSGGTLAIYLGIYDELLHAIGHIFKEFKRSIKFLIPLFLGIGISVIALAKLLGYLIDINSLIILLFFMGLVLGGTKDIINMANQDKKPINISSILSFIISFALIIILIIFSKMGDSIGIAYIDINIFNIFLLILLGMAASITMIVPGVSGSALLVVLGYYTAIVTNVVGEILNFSNISYNLQIIIPFAIGAAVGIILFSRVIEYTLNKYSKQTYYAILGFIISSVIAIFYEIKDPSSALTHDSQIPIYKNLFDFLSNNIISLIIGIILFIIGFILTKYMTNLSKEKIKKA